MLLSLALPGLAAAQFVNPLRSDRAAAMPCVLDKCLDGSSDAPDAPAQPAGRPQRPSFGRPAGPASSAPGAFEFFVLALSWSPAFCDSGAGRGRQQCADGANLGFVVHGLWPQNLRGYPSDCDANSRSPSRMALEATRGVYPDEGLARYEWRKHGTCTGLSPIDYFTLAKRARDAVTIPPALRSPGEPQTLEPLAIARAFVATNPGLRTDMMAVTCRGEQLQEVRVCFTKDLRGFTPCPEVARAACRTRAISVLPVH